MSVAGLLTALLLMLAAGFGTTAALWRGKDSILLPELFGLSVIFGAGFVSIALAAFGTMIRGLPLQGIVTLLCLLSCLYGVRRLQHHELKIHQFPSRRRWERWSSLVVLVPIILVAAESIRVAIAWDGLFIWEFKARIAYQNGGALPASIFSDATRLRFHPSYPLYVPLTETWLYLWIGNSDQTLLKILFPILFASMISLLWSAVMRLSHRPWIASITATLPLAVPMMLNQGYGLAQGYSDLLLGAVYLTSCAALLTWRIRGVEGSWYVAAAAAALLPWIKQEGVILFASLAAQAALAHGFRGWRATIAFLLPGSIVLIGWKIALLIVDVVQQNVFLPVTLPNFLANAHRLEDVADALAHQFTSTTQWSMLWLLVPLALLCVGRYSHRIATHLAAALMIPMVGYIIPYVFTTLDLRFHINTSLDRLILQLSLVGLLSLGLALSARTLNPPEELPGE